MCLCVRERERKWNGNRGRERERERGAPKLASLWNNFPYWYKICATTGYYSAATTVLRLLSYCCTITVILYTLWNTLCSVVMTL